MKEYIKRIIYFTLISAVINQLLPSEEYRKYGRILSGFIIILLFLDPFLKWSSINTMLTQKYESLLWEGRQQMEYDIEDNQQEMTASCYEQMITEELKNEGYSDAKVQVTLTNKEGTIKKIVLHLQKTADKEEENRICQKICREYVVEEGQVFVRN